MAVLNKIRERSVFLIIIIALALFSFVLADVIRNGGFSSQKSQNVIATVDDEPVDREEFARQVEAYQRNSRGNVTTTQAVNQVWNSVLNQTLLKKEFDKLGIEVGQEQINSVLRQQFAGNPNFTNQAGMFDINLMREYIANLKATSPEAYNQWIDVEENIAEQAKANIYYNMIRAGIGATDLEGKQAYQLANDKVDFKFISLPYSNVEDVEVSKSEIKDYIKKHKNQFETEANRNIQYVFFEEKASAEDNEEVKKNIKSLLEQRVVYNEVSKMNDTLAGFNDTEDNESFLVANSDMPVQEQFLFKKDLPQENANTIANLNVGETFGPYKEGGFYKVSKVTAVKQIPDSVKAKDILISYQGTPVGQELTRTKEEAKQLADSLVKVLNEDTSKFGEIAANYSNDTSTKDQGGDLGWITYSQVNQDSDVIDYLFTAEAGKAGIVADEEIGYYILLAEEQTEAKKAIKVATLAKQIEPSETTQNKLFTEVTKFEIAAGEGEFVKQAEEKSYEVKPVKGLKSMQENIPGIGSQRQIVQWSFSEDTKAGDIKRFDTPNGYVVAQVTAVNKKGLMSVEEASPKVTPILRNKKKAEKIKESLSGNSLAEMASSQNVSVETANAVTRKNPTIPGASREPKAVGAAFALEKGQTSKPIAGRKGVYVIELLQKTKAPELGSYTTFAKQETQSRNARITQRLGESLKNSAEIEDNRANFY